MPSHQKKSKVNLDDLTIGDRVLVNLHHGRKEEALVKAIIPTKDGKQFQVDFGNDQTALVEDWQIMEKL